MARKKKTETKRPIESYEHRDKQRVNNPPVGLVTPETDPDAGQKKKRYAYDPHLDPQLVWAGKAEHTSFEVPTVSLHVHERIDPRTIIEAVRKLPSPGASRHPLPGGEGWGEGAQLPLFEVERKEPLRSAIEFYRHKHGWSNRLIAGDSLLVMNSLLEKEGMAGKVQMIYIDPPYGIKYGSNFQPFVNKRDVKDGKDEDLTSEPEQIRAFRDTWELGIHSYLTYLRDRLLLARELLTESGSIFVQISDENVHRVRCLMDEVFGAGNFAGLIAFRKTSAVSSPMARLNVLASAYDYILWYARDISRIKYRQLFTPKQFGEEGASQYTLVELSDGTRRRMTAAELENPKLLPEGSHVFGADNLSSPGASAELSQPYKFNGRKFSPGSNHHWKTTLAGMDKLAQAGRLLELGSGLYYVRYLDDFPVVPLLNSWDDTSSSFMEWKLYVVQTTPKVIARCLLMTTDPGDLVFDPTCGSGTTAYVAEQWGRRWITCDTSRVAITIARQRLMTAVFDYYELAHPEEGVGSGFKYKTVPHVTLKSIANNPEIDEIHARWTEKLYEFLVASFEFLDRERVRQHLEKAEFGLLEQYINDAAQTDPELKTKNSKLKTLLAERRAAIDAAIARHAPQETLYDQPLVDRRKVRVTGPFTVEAVPAPVVKSVEELLPSPNGRGVGGEGKKPLPQDLLDFARQLRKDQTDAERLMWSLLRHRRLAGFKFRRQHPIEPYVVDFYCHEAGLAVELDGGQHNEPDERARDTKRSAFLEEQGIRVLRFWNNEVFQNIEGVLQAIYDALTPALSQRERENALTPALSQRERGFIADASIARSGETLRQAEWRDELLKTGIRGKAGQHIRFARLEPLPGCRWLHADGETRPSAEGADSVREDAPAYNPMRVVVSFGPEHGPLEQRQVAQAIEEAQTLVPKPKLIVFAAFQFDPEAAKDIDETNWPGVTLLKAQMNADLLTDDLKKKRASNESFWLIGQPDVQVSSFEFLVLGDRHWRIAEYGRFKELSGLDSLAEITRLDWKDLFFYALLSQGGAVWHYLADQEGWDFHSGQYRRRSGPKQQGGIPAVSWNSARIVSGGGDIVGDLKEFGISDLDECRRVIERLRRDQEVVSRLEALAQELNFPVRSTTKNWQLKTQNWYCVTVHGFDYYNTKTGGIESGGADKIAVWLLDTDYDGRSLYPRQVFFPMAGENEGWARLARNLRAEIDEELIEAYRGTVSLPFEPGEHKRIAVKIVDDRGIESLKVIDLNEAG